MSQGKNSILVHMMVFYYPLCVEKKAHFEGHISLEWFLSQISNDCVLSDKHFTFI